MTTTAGSTDRTRAGSQRQLWAEELKLDGLKRQQHDLQNGLHQVGREIEERRDNVRFASRAQFEYALRKPGRSEDAGAYVAKTALFVSAAQILKKRQKKHLAKLISEKSELENAEREQEEAVLEQEEKVRDEREKHKRRQLQGRDERDGQERQGQDKQQDREEQQRGRFGQQRQSRFGGRQQSRFGSRNGRGHDPDDDRRGPDL